MLNYDQLMDLWRRSKGWLPLAALTLAACGNAPRATTAAAVASGLAGRVVIGPTCPVQRAGHKCERGYQTTVAVYTAHHPDRLVTTVRTASDGSFRLSLASGRYYLAATGRGRPRSTAIVVTVRPHRLTTVMIVLDTGLR